MTESEKRKKQTLAQRELVRKRRAEKLCVRCGRKDSRTVRGMWTCEPCAKRDYANLKYRKEREGKP